MCIPTYYKEMKNYLRYGLLYPDLRNDKKIAANFDKNDKPSTTFI